VTHSARRERPRWPRRFPPLPGDADVGPGEGGHIVDPIADHGHPAPFALEPLDRADLVLGKLPGGGHDPPRRRRARPGPRPRRRPTRADRPEVDRARRRPTSSRPPSCRGSRPPRKLRRARCASRRTRPAPLMIPLALDPGIAADAAPENGARRGAGLRRRRVWPRKAVAQERPGRAPSEPSRERVASRDCASRPGWCGSPGAVRASALPSRLSSPDRCPPGSRGGNQFRYFRPGRPSHRHEACKIALSIGAGDGVTVVSGAYRAVSSRNCSAWISYRAPSRSFPARRRPRRRSQAATSST
jgi:hypothetical protein